MPGSEQLSVGILAAPETTASTVFGLYDLFCSAGRDWALLTTGEPGEPRARPVVIAAGREPFVAANGAWIRPHGAFTDIPAPSIVYVPEILIGPDEPLSGRFDAAIAWLRACHEAGATLASACSGALLLAEAGLLDGCEATTHWGYCDAMARRYPKVTIRSERCLVASGEGQRIITSGGVTSYLDLGLFLAARFFGQEEAMRLARAYLIDWHSHGQLPYSSLVCSRQAADARIAPVQSWIGENYAHPAPVAAMARLSGLPDRSFKRRFRQATGLTPLDYVHTLRLEESKQLLETTDLPIDAIASEVGYEDASFFRRLFRRKVGLTPHAYRRRFAAFRKALAEAG